jgi:cytochrome c peroxidase
VNVCLLRRAIAIAASLCLAAAGACVEAEPEPDVGTTSEELGISHLPNNFPFLNPGGLDGTFSTRGHVDLESEFFQAQGTNGRDCSTCHLPSDGWSIRPLTVEVMFHLTDGTHPIFNLLDANTPTADISTREARYANFSMLRKGLFTRSRTVPANAQFKIVAVDDPFGVSTLTRLWFFRRPLATSNFLAHTVMWDGANTVGTDLRAGLIRQARGNVTGAQQGPAATDEVIFEIVDEEMSFAHAQMITFGAGSLSAGGANGGPEARSAQALVAGRFDLYDAWSGSWNPWRRQIWRGQELFNNVNVASGRRCGGCHSSANDGQNANGTMFDVGASRPAFANEDMAIFTLENLTTGEQRQTTDWGRGGSNGQWADLDKFKTPSLRGVGARAPYFHNGIAEDLDAVVDFYEDSLGFQFTAQEERDLAAFLGAL